MSASLPTPTTRPPQARSIPLLGSIPWNAALAGIGYGAGKAFGGDKAWENMQNWFGRFNHIFYIVVGVVVVALVAWGVWHWRSRRGSSSGRTCASRPRRRTPLRG